MIDCTGYKFLQEGGRAGYLYPNYCIVSIDHVTGLIKDGEKIEVDAVNDIVKKL